MATELKCEDLDSIEFGEFIEKLRESKFDSADKDSFIEVAPWLKKLYNNRTFLADYAIEQLKTHSNRALKFNNYITQILILHESLEDDFFIRAAFWPSQNDSIFKSSGASPFSYNLAHNHNFNFLTVGYIGPGYNSDYYRVDYKNIEGYVGEKVEIEFLERAALTQGKVLFYEAFYDMHSQLPAESMSVSINIMERSYRSSYSEQYSFDIDRSIITEKTGNHSSIESMFSLASFLAPEEAEDILKYISENHPNYRVRYKAIVRFINLPIRTDVEKQELLSIYIKNSNNIFIKESLLLYEKKAIESEAWLKGRKIEIENYYKNPVLG